MKFEEDIIALAKAGGMFKICIIQQLYGHSDFEMVVMLWGLFGFTEFDFSGKAVQSLLHFMQVYFTSNFSRDYPKNQTLSEKLFTKEIQLSEGGV